MAKGSTLALMQKAKVLITQNHLIPEKESQFVISHEIVPFKTCQKIGLSKMDEQEIKIGTGLMTEHNIKLISIRVGSSSAVLSEEDTDPSRGRRNHSHEK